jgi:formamidopyrimidine-DNA glycosylase
MPELPEVETVARQLAPRLRGRTVQSVSILDARLRNRPTPRVAGRSIVDVRRSGKRVLIAFSSLPSTAEPLWLAVHLRMTGRLQWVDRSALVARRHLRARFRLDRGSLLFADTRRFGTFDWYRSEQETVPDGVDPLSGELTPRKFMELLGDSRQNLKAWLLRQDRLVGLGNIYASEILHAARLSPFREAASLTAAESKRLLGSTRRILRRAIQNCGTTFSDFQDARGVEGSYQQFLAVYEREDEPCRRCDGAIRRVVQQQRSTYHCRGCQR